MNEEQLMAGPGEMPDPQEEARARSEAWRLQLAEASGNVSSSDPFVYLIYRLLIEYVSVADMESVLKEVVETFEEMLTETTEDKKVRNVVFTNGFVAEYAKHINQTLVIEHKKMLMSVADASGLPTIPEGSRADFEDFISRLLQATESISKPPATEGSAAS